jgi:hypothetical protein
MKSIVCVCVFIFSASVFADAEAGKYEGDPAKHIVADLKKKELILAYHELDVNESPTGGSLIMVVAKDGRVNDWDPAKPLPMGAEQYVGMARRVLENRVEPKNAARRKLAFMGFCIKTFEWDSEKKYILVSFVDKAREGGGQLDVYLDVEGKEMTVQKLALSAIEIESVAAEGLER